MEALIWLAMAACLLQSALFSGLNLGLFSLGRLELKVLASRGDHRAARLLALREDANLALVTVLWGNVAVNVLLAQLSGSVLAGVLAFVFSTVLITVFAEILPQAWFSRHALELAGRLAPMLRAWQWLLLPVAWPSAWLLDCWLGREGMRYYAEPDLRRLIRLHMEAEDSEISPVEGQGALNFLDLDDVPIGDEGEPVAADSVLKLSFDGARPRFPLIRPDPADPFLQAVARSGKSWVVLVDDCDQPRLVLDAPAFLRQALFDPDGVQPMGHVHRPILVDDANCRLGRLIGRLRVARDARGDEVVDDDVILLWAQQRRVLTGNDILGRLLRGIAPGGHPPAQ